VNQCGKPWSEGEGSAHKPNVHKRPELCVSEFSKESDTPPPPDPDVRKRGWVGGDWVGECLPNGRSWARGERGTNKSVFDRTSLMDDP